MSGSPSERRRSTSPPGSPERSRKAGTRSPAPPAKRPRGRQYVSRACDGCRKRKVKCNGAKPVCGLCSARGYQCEYIEEDGRKNKADVADLQARIVTLEKMLTQAAIPKPEVVHPQAWPIEEPFMAEAHPPALFDQAPPRDDSSFMPPPADIPPLFTRPEPRQEEVTPASVTSSSTTSHKWTTPLQFGPTSLWSYAKNDSDDSDHASFNLELGPGDWVDWAKPLPDDLNISKAVHDSAIASFAAYYAPWCLVVDVPLFLRDLDVCNLNRRRKNGPAPPTRTAFYSPLLHVCVLYLGLHLQKDQHPSAIRIMDAYLERHGLEMITRETDDPGPATLRGINLFATCFNIRKDTSARTTGYICSGMTVATCRVLGFHIDREELVKAGKVSLTVHEQCVAAYWTVFLQDLLRAVATGSRPLLDTQDPMPFPIIEESTDREPWYSTPGLNGSTSVTNGIPSMRSSVFHWTARLGVILRSILEMSLHTAAPNRDHRAIAIAHQLDEWSGRQSLVDPAIQPLPHLLILHMLYHLSVIYLFRPYYRSTLAIQPSPSQRCDAAATATLELLRLYNSVHGIRNCPATLIPIIFTTGTVCLLKLASSASTESTYAANVESVAELMHLMHNLSLTWTEARRGLEVLSTLKSEWLPNLDPASAEPTSPQETFNVPLFQEALELPHELHEWLMSAVF